MIGRLFLMCRCRRFVGRIAGVVLHGGDGAVGVAVSRVGLAGIEGEDVGGDHVLLPWDAILQINAGPRCDQGFARKREQIARHKEACPSCGDGHKKPSLPPDVIDELMRAFDGKPGAGGADA